MRYSRKDKLIIKLLCIISFVLLFSQQAFAMHIMEGYLPLSHCVGWSVVSIPFVAYGIVKLRRIMQQNRRSMILLAMSGAFVFVISSLKIPSITGSSSHMTGTGLAAILFGPSIASILSVIVLVFQSILLAHGGLTTLGANTFSMGIIGPIITWFLFTLGKKLKLNRKANVFIAAMFGDFLTYISTSVQLGVAFPIGAGGIVSSIVKFLGVFAPTQLPLAIIEGLLTVLIVIGLESYAEAELKEIAFLESQ